ncbi:unnamed protein product [Caenorhabditis nigoni]
MDSPKPPVVVFPDQCHICLKVFISKKGLENHLVIHTNEKPFKCEVCGKGFRYGSNLHEHKSVHTGMNPFSCPYCGKSVRLKGNLKKHLMTHVTSKEELEAVWRPFVSKDKRNNPWKIQNSKIYKGKESIDEIVRKPEILKIKQVKNEESVVNLDEKYRRLEYTIYSNPNILSFENLVQEAEPIAFESYKCHVCQYECMSRMDCLNHIEIEHSESMKESEFFCKKCFRPFSDEEKYKLHMDYHEKISGYLEENGFMHTDSQPDFVVPTENEFQMIFEGYN